MAVPRIRHINTVDEMERLSDEFVKEPDSFNEKDVKGVIN